MDKETLFIYILVGFFLFGAIILIVLNLSEKYKYFSPKKYTKPNVRKREKINLYNFNSENNKEHFNLGKDFYIYNYLNSPIRIKLDSNDPDKVINIDSNNKKGFDKKDLEKYLKNGNTFSVFILISKEGEKKPCEYLFSKYKLELPKDMTIKMLHVGMVTSKWVGSDGDSHISPGLNAVQGLPWIKIHNMTEYSLSLNNNIDISPGGTLRYSGRDNFGVRLGTVFKDQNNIFPDFIFSTPATDIWYGVVSDIQQSLFGGFQLSEKFIDSTYEPQFLLENGWQGGPSYPNLINGYIPSEGPDVPPQDRWGVPVTEEV